MSDFIIASVTGSDGVSPAVSNPDGLWTTWALAQLYMGQEGEGKYVGKLQDYVVDYDTNQWYKIVAIDPTTLIPTLQAIRTVNDPAPVSDDDLFLLGPGEQVETLRVFVDKSVLPFKITADKRATVNSVLTKYCKIAVGSKLDGTDRIISKYFDGSGQYVGENIPLEVVAMPNGQNYSVKVPMTGYTTEDLAQGDTVTYEFFDDEGSLVSIRTGKVQLTSFMRQTDAASKYITSIELDSPWLSESNPNELRYPINIPLNGLNLFGIANYSDGSKMKLPVDGTRFKIMGFQEHVATIVGQTTRLVLSYNLADNEEVYAAQQAYPNGPRFMTETYQAITENFDGAYSLKLFCSPTWNTDVNQWRLEWFLYNLDRTIAINVTPYIHYADNHAPFDPNPSAYGLNQQLQVNLDLSDVNGVYRKVNFTQTLSVVLYRDATDHSGTPFTVYYESGQTPPYGQDLHADVQFVNQNLKYVNIGLGMTDQAAWLTKVLAPAKPLYDPDREPSYPVPDMFAFMWNDGSQSEFPISQWNQANQVSQAVPNGGTLNIKFFRRTPDNDLEIALCPMVITVLS